MATTRSAACSDRRWAPCWLKALEGAEDKLYREQRAAGTEDETTPAQRRADAFGLWLEDRLQPRVQLVVHSFEGAGSPHVSAETSHRPIAAPTLVTEDGSRVSAETSSRLCCDAEVVPIARGNDGSVLDVGRSSPQGVRMPVVPEAPDIGGLVPGDGPAASAADATGEATSAAHDFGLARWHGQPGIGPSTGSSLWRGERIDWGWAMVCLWGKGGDGASQARDGGY